MDEQKVQLQHPEGKKLTQINAKVYQLIHDEIINILKSTEHIKPMVMLDQVASNLIGKIDGNIKWYAEGVKLDMEAKKELVHDRKKGLIYYRKEQA